MKIALLSPITWRTPPRRYGPWEQVVSTITNGLVKKGIDATLFATGDSLTTGRLASVCHKPLGEHPGDFKVWESLHIAALMETAGEYDIIHNHYDFLPLTYSQLIKTPMVTTIHGISGPSILPVYQKYNHHTNYVSISNSDRVNTLSYIDTVYNGIDEDAFPFQENPGDYLLVFGRIHPDKGTHIAIEIAKAMKMQLLIAGPIQDEEYFRQKVEPMIDGFTICYVGNAEPHQRANLLGNAVALLHPICFEEPFGLSVAESMMCGTPVVAFKRGAMSELIKHEETGFIVESKQEAINIINNIRYINRYACRRHALLNFSKQVMIDHYIEVYNRILLAK